MFSTMMATMAGKVGAPMGLLTEEEELAKQLDPNSVVRPGEMQLMSSPTFAELKQQDPNSVVRENEAMSLRELVNQRAQQAGDAFRSPGEYLMGQVQPRIDALRDSLRDPAEYAEMRLQMAMDGRLDREEAERARRLREMQAFQQQGLSNYLSGQRATQLPTGYFNNAQRGLF